MSAPTRIAITLLVLLAGVGGFLIGRFEPAGEPASETVSSPASSTDGPPGARPLRPSAADMDRTRGGVRVWDQSTQDPLEVGNRLLRTAPSGSGVRVGPAHLGMVGTWRIREPYEPPTTPERALEATRRSIGTGEGAQVALERVTTLKLGATGRASVERIIARAPPLGATWVGKPIGHATRLAGAWTPTSGGRSTLTLQGLVNPWIEEVPAYKVRSEGELARMELLPSETVRASLRRAPGGTGGTRDEAADRESLTFQIELVHIYGVGAAQYELTLERVNE